MKGSFKPIVAIAVLILVVSAFWLGKIYAFLTVAFVLAYLLDPIVEKLVKYKVPRGAGAFLTLLIFFATLILAAAAMIPRLVAQGHELVRRLPALYASIVRNVAPMSERYLGLNVFDEIDKLLLGNGDGAALVKPIGQIAQGVFSQTFQIVTTVLGLLIIPLLAYYLLRDYPLLYGKLLYVVPRRHHKTLNEIRDRLNAVLGGFIRGQLVVSTVLSCYYAIGLTALRLDLSLVLGLLAGFLNMVPYVGIISIFGLTWLIALIHGASMGKMIGIVSIFGVGMATEGSFLTPRIVGSKVGLGPLTLIIALLVGGELMGFAGMLLGVPLAAVAKVFVDLLLDRYRSSEVFRRSESS